MPFFQEIIHEDSIAVFIGTGIRAELKKWEVISNFWTSQHFIDTKGTPII
jgi:hypothetical protein